MDPNEAKKLIVAALRDVYVQPGVRMEPHASLADDIEAGRLTFHPGWNEQVQAFSQVCKENDLLREVARAAHHARHCHMTVLSGRGTCGCGLGAALAKLKAAGVRL